MFCRFPTEATEQSISERFDRIAAEHADRAAVVGEGLSYTYAELRQRCDRIAAGLMRVDDRAAVPVCLFMDNGPLLLASIFGALRAGKIYVPIDPTYPRERNAHILEDSGATLMVCDAANAPLAASLAGDAAQVLVVEELMDASESGGLPPYPPADAGAYLIYTSGSTGLPKGVLQTHRNVLHCCMRRTNLQEITCEDRLTLFYSCSVMGAVYDIYGALLNGAALLPWNLSVNGLSGLSRWLTCEGVTVFHCVASFFREFASLYPNGSAFPGIRLVIFGGERALTRDVKAAWEVFGEECRIFAGLGCTEAGTMLAWVLDSGAELEGTVVSLGRPVEGMDVSIRDEHGKEVGAGEVGEIVVRSRYLASGYWKNAGLTAEKFEEAAGGESGGTRLYHTGDLGLCGDEGVFVHQGRADNQLSIRGFRVELGEVEGKVLAHPRVKDAVAIALDERIEVFVTLDDGGELSLEELRDFLRDRLPSHMMPGQLVVLAAMPRTPNGKIDRHSLQRGVRVATRECAVVAYEDEVDRCLAELWGGVLELDGIGLEDDFFALGGTSLKAIVMIAQVEREFGRQIPLTALVTSPRLRDFANFIRAQEMFEEEACLVPIQSDGEMPPIFWLHGLGGGGGGLLRYGALARLLGKDQPSYGVQAPRVPYTSLEMMATEYIKLIREKWPSGPYRLGGYCFGAKLAYETARQLMEAGETVDFLGLLAPPRLFDVRWTLGDRFRLCLAAAADWRNNIDRIVGATMDDRVQFLRRRIRGAARRVRRFAGRADTLTVQLDEVINLVEYPEDCKEVAETHWKATVVYRIRPYGGQIMAFDCTPRTHLRGAQIRVAWEGVAQGRLQWVAVPGTHGTMMHSPYVEVLADTIRGELDRLAGH